MPGRAELPGTRPRSPDGAQKTGVRADDNTVQRDGGGERARRTASGAVERSSWKAGHRGQPRAGRARVRLDKLDKLDKLAAGGGSGRGAR